MLFGQPQDQMADEQLLSMRAAARFKGSARDSIVKNANLHVTLCLCQVFFAAEHSSKEHCCADMCSFRQQNSRPFHPMH